MTKELLIVIVGDLISSDIVKDTSIDGLLVPSGEVEKERERTDPN